MRFSISNNKNNKSESKSKITLQETAPSSLRSFGSENKVNNRNSNSSNIFPNDILASSPSNKGSSSKRFSSFNPFGGFNNNHQGKNKVVLDRTPPVTPSSPPKPSIKFKTLKEIVTYLRSRDEDPLMPTDIERYCDKIIELMNSNEDDVQEQKLGAKAMFLLAQMDISDAEGESSTQAGVLAMLTAMEDYPDEERLQEHCCLALQVLTAWEENQAYILASQGLIDVVCTAMESHPDNYDLQISALTVICNISCSPDAVENDLAAELSYAIPPILELLKDNRDHEDIYRKGCSALAKLTEDNSKSQLIFLNDGQLGIRMAIDALHNATFSDDFTIQLASMIILQNVSSNSSLECKGRIIMHGGLERILETLECHSAISARKPGKTTRSSQIMASALQTLANLSDSNIPDHDKTRTRMGVAVPVMLRVLQRHPKLSQVQTSGHSALKNLADLHADLVIRNDGISIIMTNMADQIENPAVQKQTCRTLVKLFSKRESDSFRHNGLLSGGNNPSERTDLDLVLAIAEEDGIDLIFRSVRMHQKHRAVHEAALAALYHISCSKKLTTHQKKQLCLEENVYVLMGTVSNYFESERICEFGCGLLLNMSFFSPLQQEGMATGKPTTSVRKCWSLPEVRQLTPTFACDLFSVGGIKIVLQAMRRHGLNKKIQESASGILSGLCLDPAIHEEFVREEGISTIVSAMMVHPYQAGVQAFCCDVLASVASGSTANKQLVVDANTKDLANEAMNRHKKHKGVQNRGSALLKAIR
ncbi:MAG: hypothetical protein SGILL_006451 [Bacillariaceae sp.]